MLTDDQKDIWNKNGYLKIENFYSPEIINKISQFSNDISNWEISEDKWMMWFEKNNKDQKILSKVENFLDYHNALYETLLADKKIGAIIKELLNEDAMLLKELLVYKYPDSGGYRPHQDIYHVAHNILTRQVDAIVTIAIDSASPANGGLYMSPGNHKQDVIDMDSNGVILPEIASKLSWEPVNCNAGDILIFDNYVPHYSEPNKSNSSRRVIYLVYQRQSTLGFTSRKEYNERKRALMPPEGKNVDINNLKKINGIFYRE